MGWWLGFCWLVRQNRLADFLRHPLVGISHQPAALGPCSHVCWPSVPASSASSFFSILVPPCKPGLLRQRGPVSFVLRTCSGGDRQPAVGGVQACTGGGGGGGGAKLADRVRSSGPGG